LALELSQIDTNRSGQIDIVIEATRDQVAPDIFDGLVVDTKGVSVR
jgi:hypothetical protein